MIQSDDSGPSLSLTRDGSEVLVVLAGEYGTMAHQVVSLTCLSLAKRADLFLVANQREENDNFTTLLYINCCILALHARR